MAVDGEGVDVGDTMSGCVGALGGSALVVVEVGGVDGVVGAVGGGGHSAGDERVEHATHPRARASARSTVVRRDGRSGDRDRIRDRWEGSVCLEYLSSSSWSSMGGELCERGGPGGGVQPKLCHDGRGRDEGEKSKHTSRVFGSLCVVGGETWLCGEGRE